MALPVSASAPPVLPADEAGAALLAALRAGDSRPLDTLCRQQRGPFLIWSAQRYPLLSDDDRRDAFQDALIIFYENALSGRLQTLTASPASYLFGIGARQCHTSGKKFGKTINLSPFAFINDRGEPEAAGETDDFDAFQPLLAELVEDPYQLDFSPDDAELARQQAFTAAWNQLAASCREILTGFYYENQTIPQLTISLAYEDANSTKSRKSQCLSRLKELLRPWITTRR